MWSVAISFRRLNFQWIVAIRTEWYRIWIFSVIHTLSTVIFRLPSGGGEWTKSLADLKTTCAKQDVRHGGGPMDPISTTQLIDALRWRYAVKQFDPTRKIPGDEWTALEDVLHLAPSSFGLQPWRFVVVDDVVIREQLVGHSWGQRQVVEASHLVVFAVRHPLDESDVVRHIERTAEVRSQDRATLAGFEGLIKDFISRPEEEFDVRGWAARQVYIAMGSFMTAAALLGIDTCPMEGIDPEAYDRVLGLAGSGYETLAACPAGYRHADDKHATLPKVRFPKPEIIHLHS